jgi:hypothetical protein
MSISEAKMLELLRRAKLVRASVEQSLRRTQATLAKISRPDTHQPPPHSRRPADPD